VQSRGEQTRVLDWIRSLPEHPSGSKHGAGSISYFREFGPLDPEPSRSPLVNVFVPNRKRGVLTTIGKLHSLATPLSAFPALNKVNKRFRDWLRELPCIYPQRADFVHEWEYFLECSACNWDSDIFALPDGMVDAFRSMTASVSSGIKPRGIIVLAQATEAARPDGQTTPHAPRLKRSFQGSTH
jgi:hypothetical protein